MKDFLLELWQASAARRIVALVDLLIGIALAMPTVGGQIIGILLGVPAPTEFNLAINLLGLVVVVWSVARLKITRARNDLAALDNLARVGITIYLIRGMVLGGLSPVLTIFVATELGGLALQVRWGTIKNLVLRSRRLS